MATTRLKISRFEFNDKSIAIEKCDNQHQFIKDTEKNSNNLQKCKDDLVWSKRAAYEAVKNFPSRDRSPEIFMTSPLNMRACVRKVAQNVQSVSKNGLTDFMSNMQFINTMDFPSLSISCKTMCRTINK